MGSKAGAATGGQLHSVNATSGAVSSSGQLALFNSVGVRDAPIVDSTAGKVYTFVGADLTNRSAVYQFSTASSISGLTSPVVKSGWQWSAPSCTRGRSTTPIGRVLRPTVRPEICTSAEAPTQLHGGPTLWTVPIANNVMGTPVAGPTLVSNNADCSPVTEVMNGANDYLFASVSASGNSAGCNGACVYSFQIPTVPIGFDTTSTSSAHQQQYRPIHQYLDTGGPQHDRDERGHGAKRRSSGNVLPHDHYAELAKSRRYYVYLFPAQQCRQHDLDVCDRGRRYHLQ